MANPDIMPQYYPMCSSPAEKGMIVLLGEAVGFAAVGKVMQRCPPKGMVAGIYACMGSDIAEFADGGISNAAFLHEIAVVP
jgi:hypothetical protein